MTGVVASVIAARGFGFISPAGTNEPDIFFHLSALDGLDFDEALLERTVQYDLEYDARRGRSHAINVRAA